MDEYLTAEKVREAAKILLEMSFYPNDGTIWIKGEKCICRPETNFLTSDSGKATSPTSKLTEK
jgi:hypothetical protein